MNLSQPLPHGWRDAEGRVGHSERSEHLFGEIAPQLFAADSLHHFSSPVDIDAVFPALTRIEVKRQLQGRVLATDDRRQTLGLLIAHYVRVPELVAEAGRVREQVAQRDRPLRRSGAWLTVGVEPFEHDNLTQCRNHL